MTVGIRLSNNSIAVAVADARRSANYGVMRESDSANKLSAFKTDNFSTLIYGTGRADLLEGVKSRLSSYISSSDLDDFVGNLQSDFVNHFDDLIRQNLRAAKNELQHKASLFVDPEMRRSYIHGESQRLTGTYDQMKQNSQTTVSIVGFQNSEPNKVRSFNVYDSNVQENFFDHEEIGSGSDAASLYMNAKLQGASIQDMDVADMLFYALNGFNHATLNGGVGGNPRVGILKEGEMKILDTPNTVFMTNLSGIYLAEDPEFKLDKRDIQKYYTNLLNRSTSIDEVLQETGLPKICSQVSIPYSSWQTAANQKI